MTEVAVAPTRRRMQAGHRREQLLDAAASVVVELGAAAMNMDRLAERAGVSRALPYRHFADADAALVALYQRETTALGRHVVRTLEAAPADADLVALSISAYFDALTPRRAVLAALSAPGSSIPALADPGREAQRFAARVLRHFLGADRETARAVAGMVQGAIVGAAATHVAEGAPRERLEQALARMVRAAISR